MAIVFVALASLVSIAVWAGKLPSTGSISRRGVECVWEKRSLW